MLEIFNNIRPVVKHTAETAWQIALLQSNPVKAANFLNNIIDYYIGIFSEDELDFLRFYFNMKMENMKND